MWRDLCIGIFGYTIGAPSCLLALL